MVKRFHLFTSSPWSHNYPSISRWTRSTCQQSAVHHDQVAFLVRKLYCQVVLRLKDTPAHWKLWRVRQRSWGSRRRKRTRENKSSKIRITSNAILTVKIAMPFKSTVSCQMSWVRIKAATRCKRQQELLANFTIVISRNISFNNIDFRLEHQMPGRREYTPTAVTWTTLKFRYHTFFTKIFSDTCGILCSMIFSCVTTWIGNHCVY